jgi:transposase
MAANPVKVLAKLAALGMVQGSLMAAPAGKVSDVDRRVIRERLAEVDRLGRDIAVLDTDIEVMARAGWPDEMRRLCGVPGMGPTLAAVFIAETGGDMSAFASARHLASWAGLAPGMNSSAGKSKPSKARKGDKRLKACLTLAWGNAAKKKGTFFGARYSRILRGHGKKQARVAVARTMAVTLWTMLSNQTDYAEKGAGWYTAQATDSQRRRARQRALATLRDLGWQADLSPLGQAA